MRKDSRHQNNNKTRGYYQSIYDKYISAAKECNSSGDKVMAEYNLQFAEHYMRFMNEKFPLENKKNTSGENNSAVQSDKTAQPDKEEDKNNNSETPQEASATTTTPKKRRTRCKKTKEKQTAEESAS